MPTIESPQRQKRTRRRPGSDRSMPMAEAQNLLPGRALCWGDYLTIEGHGRGARGQLLIDGMNQTTGLKNRVVREFRYLIVPD